MPPLLYGHDTTCVGHDKTNMGASPPIQRAPGSRPTPMQDMGVYHCGLDVFVAQEFCGLQENAQPYVYTFIGVTHYFSIDFFSDSPLAIHFDLPFFGTNK